ncbi:MAG: hypothetical protein FLDDKLPJ_00670 [Phycisphaerae bacterium]|nr:hypothetical protein [Phycisphaerae bacterium]
MEAYLDGRLAKAEQAAFERAVADDPDARAEIEVQRRIDAALRREFAPPAEMPTLWTNGQTFPAGQLSSPDRAARRFPRRTTWALAAALALAVTAAVYVALTSSPPAVTPIVRHRESFVEVRERLLADRFEPDWVCEVGPKFAMSVYWRLGQPLLVGAIPSGVNVLGWSYCNALSPETMVLLTRVDDRPVVIYVDRKAHDRSQSAPEGLRLFRGEVGDLVLYELTQAESASVLPLFFEPAIEEGWKDISIYED